LNRRPGLAGCDSQLARVYDLALTDLDGVAFTGSKPIPHAAVGIQAARAAGMGFCFVTNNASRSPAAVVEHLASVGIAAGDREVFTASQAGAALLAEHIPARSRVLVVGGSGLVDAVIDAGFEPVFSAEDSPAAVVQGYGPQVDWEALAEAAYAIAAGAPFYATNLDKTLPTERGLAPGNGALVAAVRTATGVEPVSAGKPAPSIFWAAARRAGAAAPLVVGDRLDTDLAGARNAGLPGLMVLTGVNDPLDLALARPAERPTYVGRDLRALTEPHPAPVFDAGWWVVDDAAARPAGQGVDVRPGGWLNMVRAVASAAWAAVDAGIVLDPVRIPVPPRRSNG
jgi:HAD superfamily hydrolase (TIGR01450 family)